MNSIHAGRASGIYVVHENVDAIRALLEMNDSEVPSPKPTTTWGFSKFKYNFPTNSFLSSSFHMIGLKIYAPHLKIIILKPKY
jgi:hypothetical protein